MSLSGISSYAIKVFDLTGPKIKSLHIFKNKTGLTISGKGIFIIKLSDERNQITKKHMFIRGDMTI